MKSKWGTTLRGIGLRKADLGTRHTLYLVTALFNGGIAGTSAPNAIVTVPQLVGSAGGVATLTQNITNLQRERGLLIERADWWLHVYNTQLVDGARLHLLEPTSGVFLAELSALAGDTLGNLSGPAIYNVPTIDTPRVVLWDDIPSPAIPAGGTNVSLVASLKSESGALNYDMLIRLTWWDIVGVHTDEYIEEDAAERARRPLITDRITNNERERRPGEPYNPGLTGVG